MRTFKMLISSSLLLVFLPDCASTAQPTTSSNEMLPPWVGTPAKGSPPRSERSLPEGVSNGDIVFGDNLYYFIWENTKSRIWFPQTLSNDDLFSLPDGADSNFHLVGSTQADSIPGYLVTTENGMVYWIDPVKGNKYPIDLKIILRTKLDAIPTAYGEQYFPTY